MQTFEMEMSKYAIEILTKANNMDRVMEFVELCVKNVGSQRISKQLALVGEELAFNIFSYAYEAPDKFVLRICLYPDLDKVTMEFRDAGKPYNPLEYQAEDLDVHISERKMGGLGITLSKKLTDNQVYRYEDGHNILLVEKFIGTGGQSYS